jgi:hypothetical protein
VESVTFLENHHPNGLVATNRTRPISLDYYPQGDSIMSDASRRTFLTAAGAGAAAVGIAAFAPGSASAATRPSASASTGLPSGEPLVAYVSDASTGELTVMVGEREVHIKNPSLVSQLHAATR